MPLGARVCLESLVEYPKSGGVRQEIPVLPKRGRVLRVDGQPLIVEGAGNPVRSWIKDGQVAVSISGFLPTRYSTGR